MRVTVRTGILVGVAFAAICLLVGSWLLPHPKPSPAAVRPAPSRQAKRPAAPAAPQEKATTQSQAPSNETLTAVLQSDLQTVRSQLELYKVQHRVRWPDGGNFVLQMTRCTQADGRVLAPEEDRSTSVGPYLQRIPANPFIQDADKAAQVKAGTGPCPGDGTTGWYFNTQTGRFSANDPANKDL